MIYKLSLPLQQKLDQMLQRFEADNMQRLCTGVIIYKNEKILLVRRVPEDTFGGYYELAGGGIEEGEDIISGLFRECKEELGLSILHINDILDGFDFKARNGNRVRQINFFVEVEDLPIQLNPKEHDDILWVSKADYIKMNISDEMKVSIETFFKIYK